MGVEGRFYKDRYDKLDINVKSSNNDLEIILKQLDDTTFFDINKDVFFTYETYLDARACTKASDEMRKIMNEVHYEELKVKWYSIDEVCSIRNFSKIEWTLVLQVMNHLINSSYSNPEDSLRVVSLFKNIHRWINRESIFSKIFLHSTPYKNEYKNMLCRYHKNLYEGRV